MNRRVVVTGIGLVCGSGNTKEEVWSNLLAGRSGVGPMTRFDAINFPVRIASEVKNFDPLKFIEKKEVKKMDVFIHYAIAAAQEAIDDSGLRITDENATRVGSYIGSGIGGFGVIEREHEKFLKGGPAPDLALLHPRHDCESRLGSCLHPLRGQGAELGHLHRLLYRRPRHRRQLPDHPARRRRCHDLRRRGGGHHADGRRRVRGHARALDAQRRARAGEPPLGRRSRRVRDRRRRGHPDPGRAGTRPRARREDLRRDRGLRHGARRVPHHAAVRGRRTARSA